jgi:hypothetical protein
MQLLESLALAYAWYRFAVAGLHHFLVSAMATGRIEVSPLRTKRIRNSVRLVARYVFVLAVVLLLAAYILGRGYLFYLVVDVAWIGALPIGYQLTRQWQSETTAAYLAQRPQGRLAQLLLRNGATRGWGGAAAGPLGVGGDSRKLGDRPSPILARGKQ